MIAALFRKAHQVGGDPALRRFLVERALGRVPRPATFTPGRPPYLDSVALAPFTPSVDLFRVLPDALPNGPLTLSLPGAEVTLAPDEAALLFDRHFPDLETRLAVHRFAWLPLAGDGVDPAWVATLWRLWRDRFGTPGPGWEWHPYTAAERAINLLAFAARHGLPSSPEDSLGVLAAHGPAIAARLEYGGEHMTGNHLANNGRGLYLIGRALGWEACAQMGLTILRSEARRLFLPSGILREGSSHYHLLLLRNYLSAWRAAEGHPEAAELAAICRRAQAVLPMLAMPGGFPLVGDISPDCPPAFLADLLPRGGEWDARALACDGWLRVDRGDFALLIHAAPQGWPFMPGHGHHDLGGFELHWRGQPLFVDAGRGGYGETGEAALYRSAAVHNLLQLDGVDPTAPNRPYYDDSFRRREGGAPPRLEERADGARLTHYGFRRQGATLCVRDWVFAGDGLVICDRVDGAGRHRLTRRLVTPWPVRGDGAGVVVETPRGQIRVGADCPLTTRLITRWVAYGKGVDATAILADTSAFLPWSGKMRMEIA